MADTASTPPPRLHYAWVVAAVTFVVLLITAGVRATPGVLMVPLESEFGWSRATISVAVAINIALFGLIGPFAASVMNRWGLRRVVLAALALLAVSVALIDADAHRVAADCCCGACWSAPAPASPRWCWPRSSRRAGSTQRRGVVLGALSAANATGQLVFLPLLAGVVETQRLAHRGADRRRRRGGRLRRRAPVHARPAGGHRPAAVRPGAPTPRRRPGRRRWRRSRRWRTPLAIAGVLGARRHLLRLRREHQRPDRHAPHRRLPRRTASRQVRSAQLLALMGIFDILGTTASGWLTDRYSSRHLLFGYYTLRGLSLLFLPVDAARPAARGLGMFAVFYGLDWIATVPPTVQADHRGVRPREHRRHLRLDRRQPSARRVDGGVRRRRHPHRAGRLPARVPDCRRPVPHRRGVVPRRRTPCPQRSGDGGRAERGVVGPEPPAVRSSATASRAISTSRRTTCAT